jgi:hypothetical protein
LKEQNTKYQEELEAKQKSPIIDYEVAIEDMRGMNIKYKKKMQEQEKNIEKVFLILYILVQTKIKLHYKKLVEAPS